MEGRVEGQGRRHGWHGKAKGATSGGCMSEGGGRVPAGERTVEQRRRAKRKTANGWEMRDPSCDNAVLKKNAQIWEPANGWEMHDPSHDNAS